MSEETHGDGGGLPADQVAPEPSIEGGEKKEEGRLAGWSRKALRWIVAAGVVFALGVAVVWVVGLRSGTVMAAMAVSPISSAAYWRIPNVPATDGR